MSGPHISESSNCFLGKLMVEFFYIVWSVYPKMSRLLKIHFGTKCPAKTKSSDRNIDVAVEITCLLSN